MEGSWETVLARPITLPSPRGYTGGQGLEGLGDVVLTHPEYIALPKRLQQGSGVGAVGGYCACSPLLCRSP